MTQTGSFDISAPDGVKSLSVAGVVLIADGVVVGLPQAVPSPLGNSLSITAISFDADTGTGTISYAYTLLDNEYHTQPANDAVLGESFSVVFVITSYSIHYTKLYECWRTSIATRGMPLGIVWWPLWLTRCRRSYNFV